MFCLLETYVVCSPYFSGQYGSGEDYLSSMYEGGYRNSEDEMEFTEEELAMAEEQLAELTPEEIAVLTDRGPLTPLFMPMIIKNKMNIIKMLIANKIMSIMAG